ncbi:MAG: hypothetical protein U1E28_22680 [Beijerinckiaceae bacterium]
MIEATTTDWTMIGRELGIAGAVAETVDDADAATVLRLATQSDAAAILTEQSDRARALTLLCDLALERLGAAASQV